MVRPHSIFVGVFLLVLARLLIDPWLSSDSHVLPRPITISQPAPIRKKQDTIAYDYDSSYITEVSARTWPGAKGSLLGSYDDFGSKEQLIRTLYEYNMPEELVPEREAYHISISDPLISPSATREIFRAAKPLCKALGNNVAIVGNGPIRDADMQALEANASCVIRFNRISLKYDRC